MEAALLFCPGLVQESSEGPRERLRRMIDECAGLTLTLQGKTKFIAALDEGIVARMTCSATADEVKGWIAEFGEGSGKAAVALRLCVLKHEELLRNAGLDTLLRDLDYWRALEKQIRAHPALLRALPPSDARDRLIAELSK